MAGEGSGAAASRWDVHEGCDSVTNESPSPVISVCVSDGVSERERE